MQKTTLPSGALGVTVYHAVAATDECFEHGEGPRWDPVRGRLLWVDLSVGRVLEGRLDGERVEVTRRVEFAEMVTVVVPARDRPWLLVGGQERLFVLDADGDGARTDGPRIVPAGAGRRLNDGATDPAGRFLVGTMPLAGDSERETLVRLEPDGRLTTLDADLSLSNGLAWSLDGRRMFSVDTLRHVVWVRAYDPESGAVGPRERHLDLAPALPDGIAIDAEDHLWIALFGAGEVRRYAPDGSLVDRVLVPVPRVTSVAFAGEGLRRLLITSASFGLSDVERRAAPDSGRIFIASVGVSGVPAVPWAGARF